MNKTRFPKKIPMEVWAVLFWALAALPNLTVRSFVWEEGTNAELARNILAHGNIAMPSVYDYRWAEKPSLLAWLIAGAGSLTGGVNEWSARIPGMLAALFTALLVLRLARRHASPAAAFLAAASFLFCPMVLRKLTIAEPDTVITALSFAAFTVWWGGRENSSVRSGKWGRWFACGALLAAAALAKGPQPVAYFALGIGGFLVARREWRSLPGLALCLAMPALAVAAWAYIVYQPGDLGIWMGYMRLDASHVGYTHRFLLPEYLDERLHLAGGLLLDLLPITILLPFLFREYSQPSAGAPVGKNSPAAALLWYAVAATLVLFLWPGAKTRYAMPAVPALAAAAGLVVDDLWLRRRLLVQVVAAIVAGLFAWQMALVCVVMPLHAAGFGATRISGRAIDRAIALAPAPVFDVFGPNTNQLFYVSQPIREIHDMNDLPAITPPAWIIIPADGADAWIRGPHPGAAVTQIVRTTSGPKLAAIRLERSGAPLPAH